MKTKLYLAIIGLMGLTALSAPAFAHDGGGPGVPGHHMGCESLPPDKAKMVHEAMRDAREKDKVSFEKIRVLHEKMRSIVSADKFDKSAFIATRKEITALRAKMENNRAEAMANVFARLAPKEREEVIRHMMMKRHGGWQRHGDKGEWQGRDNAPAPNAPVTNDGRNHSWDNLNN